MSTGPITGPYEIRNSRVFGGSSEDESVAYNYRVPRSGWKSLVPAFKAAHTDDEMGTVYFKSFSVAPDEEDDDYLILSLNYTTVLAAVSIGGKEDDDDLWTITVATLEKPLETHPNYLMKWNHDLYQHKDKADNTPAWFDTATNQQDADGTQWKWAKESPGDEWRLSDNGAGALAEKTKAGVEAYYLPQPISRYQFWHSSKSNVEAVLQTVATRVTPAETFGYTGAWLVTNVSVEEDGSKYRGTVEYTYADVWDTELYTGP